MNLYLSLFALVGTALCFLWILAEVGFIVFCRIFGVVDVWLQDRHWDRLRVRSERTNEHS